MQRARSAAKGGTYPSHKEVRSDDSSDPTSHDLESVDAESREEVDEIRFHLHPLLNHHNVQHDSHLPRLSLLIILYP